MKYDVLQIVAGPVFVFHTPQWLETTNTIIDGLLWIATAVVVFIVIKKLFDTAKKSKQVLKSSGGIINDNEINILRSQRNLILKLLFIPLGPMLFGLQRVLTMEKEYENYQLLMFVSLLISASLLIVWITFYLREKTKIASKLK